VELVGRTDEALPHLPSNHIAILSSDVEMKAFHHPSSGHSLTLHRHQVPLNAAFAITAHKAQGQTMNKVIVDLNSCIGTEAIYIMVSRCTSLEGLMILRPFSIQKITTHRSQEARDEFSCLDRLNTETGVEHRDSLIRYSGPPLAHTAAWIEGALDITALFSREIPASLNVAAELLSQIWDRGVGHDTLHFTIPHVLRCASCDWQSI